MKKHYLQIEVPDGKVIDIKASNISAFGGKIVFRDSSIKEKLQAVGINNARIGGREVKFYQTTEFDLICIPLPVANNSLTLQAFKLAEEIINKVEGTVISFEKEYDRYHTSRTLNIIFRIKTLES